MHKDLKQFVKLKFPRHVTNLLSVVKGTKITVMFEITKMSLKVNGLIIDTQCNAMNPVQQTIY